MLALKSTISRAILVTNAKFLNTSATLGAMKKTQFPPRPKINEDDIEEVFIKGGYDIEMISHVHF